MKRLFKEYHNYLLLLLIIIVFSISLISISYYNSKHSLIKDITKFDKEYLIPYNSPMIKEINKNKKELVIELLEGME